MRTFLTLLIVAMATNAVAAEGGAYRSHDVARASTPAPHAAATDHSDFVCRKDHAGLDSVAVQSGIDAKTKVAAALQAGGTVVSIGVKAMHCAFCASSIEKAFSARAEIAAASVNVHGQTITLVIAKDAALDDGAIARIIERRGYDVSSITRGANDGAAKPEI